eukprot:2246671-Rhodomonas_salina.3
MTTTTRAHAGRRWAQASVFVQALALERRGAMACCGGSCRRCAAVWGGGRLAGAASARTGAGVTRHCGIKYTAPHASHLT